MTKLKVGLLLLAINCAVLAWLVGGCAKATSLNETTGRAWSIALSGANSAVITFGNGIASGESVVYYGGVYSGINNYAGNLFIAAGNSTGGQCQFVSTGGSVVIGPLPGGVEPGSSTSSAKFTMAADCGGGNLLTNLEIGLGSSTAGLMDINNNYIVEPGKSAICTVVAPGNSGVVGCTVTY